MLSSSIRECPKTTDYGNTFFRRQTNLVIKFLNMTGEHIMYHVMELTQITTRSFVSFYLG